MNACSDHGQGRTFPFGDVVAALVDGKGIVRGWSRAAAQLLDRPPADVCGHSLRRLLVQGPDPTCEPGSAGQALLRHRSGRAVEVTFEVLPFRGTPHLLVLAAPTHHVTCWERNEAFVRALLAQDRVGVGIHDMDLMTLDSNVTPEMFGGIPVLDSELREIIRDPDAAAALRQVLVTGIPMIDRKQHVRTPRVPGEEWCLSLSAFRLKDAKGQSIGLATLFTDITEQQRARHHLDLRHTAATRVGHSLDVLRTAQDLVDVLVPALGDLAWVSLAEAVLSGDEPAKLTGPGQWHLRRAAAASVGPWPPGLWPAELGDEPFPMPDVPVLRRIQHGETVVAPDRASFMAMIEFDPQLAAFLIPEHGHSLVAAPLFARGLVLGAVVVWRTHQPEKFDQADAELLTEIATRGALSVDNARRYTREHREAVVLQQRLLPRATTNTSAAATAGFYRPAGGGADISGDWFDAIPLPSLRVALIIGDVTGHGLPATATMGRLRAAIRTLANLEMEPDELLAHVDDLVQQLGNEAPQGLQDTVGATCLYVVYDPVTARCAIASAGHPPPIVVSPDGMVQELEVSPGPPLGVGGMPFEVAEINLEPGSILALYTDGLIEHGNHDLAAGIRQLTDSLVALSSPDRSLDDIGRSLLAARSSAPRDDMALLLARTRATPSDNVANWEFAADLTEVARAREATTGQLTAWGLDTEDVAFTTELVVSELVTNAIRHAGGPVGLRLIREDVLVCEISDPSNTQPRLRRARSTDEGGRGLFLVAQLTTRWGCRYGHTGKTIWTEQPLGAARSR